MNRKTFFSRAAVAALLVLSASRGAAQTTLRLPGADRAVQGSSAAVFSLRPGAEGVPADAADAAFGPDGSLYVLDRGAGRVRVYGANGRPLRQMGQPGRGPGRLASPAALAVTADGRVVVSDPGQQGLAVFGADGAFQRFIPLSADGGLGGHGEVEALPDGGVLVALNAGGGHGHGGGVVLARHSLEAGARPARVVTVAEEVESVAADGGGRVRVETHIRPLFAPRLSWGVLPGGGVAVAGSVEYRVRTFTAAGAPSRVLQRPLAARAPTDADREAGRQAIRRAFSGGAQVSTEDGREMSGSGLEAMFARTPFGDRVPAVQRVAVDPRGRLWIERAGAVWGRPGPVDVVGADGTYVGTVTGESLPVAWGPGGLAASLERDVQGRNVVTVRRLPASLR